MCELNRETLAALGAPFPDGEIEFLPRAQSGGMALGLPYIDARSVMRRLDAVVGGAHWSFDFDLLSPDGKLVRGRLTVCGVTKCDAGEADGEAEPLKSAVSDALKRCAVHFGIGRYLYALPKVWAPYDGQKRRFIELPRLDPQAVARALALEGIGVGPKSKVPSPESAGDRAAADRVEGAEKHGTYGAATGAGKDPSKCAECGKGLTRGQIATSLQKHARPLCPAHQKAAEELALK